MAAQLSNESFVAIGSSAMDSFRSQKKYGADETLNQIRSWDQHTNSEYQLLGWMTA